VSRSRIATPADQPLTTTARGRFSEVAIVAAIGIAVAVASLIFQRQLTVNNGHGWDGNFYYMMAEQAGDGQRLTTEAPFVYRILVPLMAAVVSPNDYMQGFQIVNAVAIAVMIVLMIVWFRLYVSSVPIRIALIALFLTAWAGPLRSYFWYPVLVDYWLLPALLAGLLIVEKMRRGGRLAIWLPILCAVSIFAATVREAGLLVPLAALFTFNPISGRGKDLRAKLRGFLSIRPLLAIPALAGGITLVGIRVLVVTTGAYGFLISAGHWLIYKRLDIYALGWFVAFGPVLILPIFYWRACLQFLRLHQAIAAFLVGLVGIAWIGGADTERFLFWGAPVIYLMIGLGLQELACERPRVAFIAILVILQAVSARLFWVLPAAAVAPSQVSETVVLTPIGTNIAIDNVTASDAATSVQLASEFEYLLIAVLLLGMLIWMRRRRQLVSRVES